MHLNLLLCSLSAWKGPPNPPPFARTDWDTCPALLAMLILLALKVLFNATQKEVPVLTHLIIVGYLQSVNLTVYEMLNKI